MWCARKFSKKRILHECSSFIEVIKQVEEQRKNARLAKHFTFFLQQEYRNTNVRFFSSYDIKITLNSHFWCKKVIILSFVCNLIMDVITFPEHV